MREGHLAHKTIPYLKVSALVQFLQLSQSLQVTKITQFEENFETVYLASDGQSLRA